MQETQAYLLAAGHGRRAGGPKAWQIQDNKSLLFRQLDFLLSRFQPKQIIVSIQAPWLERCRSIQPEVQWVPVDPDAPALGSIIALVDSHPFRSWAFLYHIDMPVWEAGLFDALAGSIPESERSGTDAIIPSFDGRKGHPILLSPKLQKPLLSLDPATDRLDHWLPGRKCRIIDVPYHCILENWNQPPNK